MKNNIIKDDREIAMKIETTPTDISENTEIATNNNGSHEPSEMNTTSLTDLPDSIDPMPMADLPESIDSMPIAELPMVSIDPMPMADESLENPAVAGQSTSVEIAAFFKRATSATTEFFNENRSILKTLGWIFLAIIGIKFVLAALGTVDDIPLVTPILKLVGLVSVIRFTWRYLIREHDRQELVKIIDRTKAEVLGNRQSAS